MCTFKRMNFFLIIQSARHIIRYAHSACHVSNSTQSHGPGAKIKESYFIELQSKLFLHEVNRNSPKLQGKDILIL